MDDKWELEEKIRKRDSIGLAQYAVRAKSNWVLRRTAVSTLKVIVISDSRTVKKRFLDRELVRGLSLHDRDMRKTIAEVLDATGWKPSNEHERTNYLIAKERWDDVAKLGKPAIPILLSWLKFEDVYVRLNATRILGSIGDTKLIKPIIHATVPHLDENMSNYYKTLLPVTVEAVVKTGEAGIQPLSNMLPSLGPLLGIPVIWSLFQLGNKGATEVIVDWIFKVGPLPTHSEVWKWNPDGKPPSTASLIKTFVPEEMRQKFLGYYAEPILGIFSWKPTDDSEKVDVSECDAAVRWLNKTKTTIATNILYRVASIHHVTAGIRVGPTSVRFTALDFRLFRQMAKDEIKRRGNPRYDATAYSRPDAW